MAKRTMLAAILIAGVALALRLWQLAERPFQYDEGQVAYFSWVLSETGDYHYQPVLHGPLTYYLNALSFLIGGAADFTARLPSALAGTLLVVLPFGIRRQLGTVGAVTAAVLLAISPSFLYYSRFDREDILITCLVLALLVVGVRFFDQPQRWHPAALGALLAACFATKESTFITVAIIGAGLLGAQAGGWPVLRHLRAPGWRVWLLGALAFAVVYVLLFSFFFVHPEGVWDGLYTGPKYWAEQHDVNRGGEAWPLYTVMLVGQEWLVLALGGIGIAAAIIRRRPLDMFCVWLFAASLVTYSYAGERFAWLVLQMLLPLVLLAGIGMQWMWSSARPRWRVPAVLATGLVSLLFAWTAIDISFNKGTDPRELLVVVQSDPDVLEIRDRVQALAERDPSLTVTLDGSEHSTFPFAWYFRDLHTDYVNVDRRGFLPTADVLVLSRPAFDLQSGRIDGYDAQPFTQRRFWGRTYDSLTPASLWRWMRTRQPWDEGVGSLGSVLLVRKPG